MGVAGRPYQGQPLVGRCLSRSGSPPWRPRSAPPTRWTTIPPVDLLLVLADRAGDPARRERRPLAADRAPGGLQRRRGGCARRSAIAAMIVIAQFGTTSSVTAALTMPAIALCAVLGVLLGRRLSRRDRRAPEIAVGGGRLLPLRRALPGLRRGDLGRLSEARRHRRPGWRSPSTPSTTAAGSGRWRRRPTRSCSRCTSARAIRSAASSRPRRSRSSRPRTSPSPCSRRWRSRPRRWRSSLFELVRRALRQRAGGGGDRGARLALGDPARLLPLGRQQGDRRRGARRPRSRRSPAR